MTACEDLTAMQAAHLLCMTLTHLARACAEGRIESITVDDGLRVPVEEVSRIIYERIRVARARVVDDGIWCAPGEANVDGRRVKLERPVSISFGENDQPDIPVWDAENRCPELVSPSDVGALHQPLYRAIPIEESDR